MALFGMKLMCLKIHEMLAMEERGALNLLGEKADSVSEAWPFYKRYKQIPGNFFSNILEDVLGWRGSYFQMQWKKCPLISIDLELYP